MMANSLGIAPIAPKLYKGALVKREEASDTPSTHLWEHPETELLVPGILQS